MSRNVEGKGLAKVRVLQLLKEILQVLLGTALMAVSLNVFLLPNKIAAGGMSGLGVILFHLFGISPGVTVFWVNVPLFILALIFLGWRFVARSIAGAIFFPLLIKLTAFLPALTSDLLLASIYGGVGTGVGLGLVFFAGGSTGGTALMAQLLTRFLGLSPGQGLLGSDLFIVASSGFF